MWLLSIGNCPFPTKRVSAPQRLRLYTRVTDYIRAWRVSAGKDVKAFVPLKFDLGEAFQFDWSEEGLVVGGIYHRMQVSHLKLCASRAFWLVAYVQSGKRVVVDVDLAKFFDRVNHDILIERLRKLPSLVAQQ